MLKGKQYLLSNCLYKEKSTKNRLIEKVTQLVWGPGLGNNNNKKDMIDILTLS